MSEAPRRGFISTATLATAAGVAAVVAPRAGAAPASAPAAEDATLPAGAEGAMAAYIHDVRKGEVALMVEGHEVIITDKQLVARLARAFAAARS
jgi:hypothetical protein